MSTTIHTTFSVELELGLTGVYHPFIKGASEYSGGPPIEPDEPASVEDVDISAMSFEVVERIVLDGKYEWKRTNINILDGVNIKSPDVQRFLSNLVAAIHDDAVEALLGEVDQ